MPSRSGTDREVRKAENSLAMVTLMVFLFSLQLASNAGVTTDKQWPEDAIAVDYEVRGDFYPEGNVEIIQVSTECPYEWNGFSLSPKDFLGQYCPELCTSHATMRTYGTCQLVGAGGVLCTNLECYACKSTKSCTASGTCHPKSVSHWSDTFDGNVIECLQPESFMAVVKCPDHGEGSEIGRLACESTPQSFIAAPVTDPATNVTYKNEHCALCHNVTSYKEWTLKLTCDTFQYVYTALSEEELLQMGRQSDSYCRVNRSLPEGVETIQCDASWFSNVINTCNVSGHWKSLDEDVEENCKGHKGLIDRVKGNNRTYQNLFCAICNGEKPNIKTLCEVTDQTSSGNSGHGNPFTVLFSFKTKHKELESLPQSKCASRSEIYFNGMCRNLSCTPGKILERTNNTCKTALTQIRGLVYNFTILLEPRTPVYQEKTDTELYESLIAAIQFAFNEFTKDLIEDFSVNIDLHRSNCSISVTREATLLSLIIVSGSLRATTNMTRDEVESRLVGNLLMEDSWLLLERDGFRIKKLQEADFQITSETLIFSMPVFKTSEVQRQHIPANKRIALTPMLICAYVVFVKPEFEIRTYQNDTFDPQIILIDGEFEAELQDVRRAIVQNNTLLVCYESVQNLTRRRRFQEGDEGDWQLYLLSMVVFGLSLLCLVLTLLVYLLLPALRTQPGLNIMGTCVALIVAQVTLLLSFLGIASGIWCTVLGIFLHFVWLSTFCWNFISSWHMYRAFSAKTFHNNRNIVYRKLAGNVAITIIVPSIIVASVIGTSHYLSGGVSIGYSKDGICSLDAPLLVGLSVVLPVSIIVVTNAVLFGLTVYRINQVRKLQTDLHTENERELRQYIYACVRLSFLTGFTWVLSLLAEGLDLKWMQYISVVANGGQGVLIFLSYGTTRRVLEMLSVRLGLSANAKSAMTSSINKSFTSKLSAHQQ